MNQIFVMGLFLGFFAWGVGAPLSEMEEITKSLSNIEVQSLSDSDADQLTRIITKLEQLTEKLGSQPKAFEASYRSAWSKESAHKGGKEQALPLCYREYEVCQLVGHVFLGNHTYQTWVIGTKPRK